MTQKPLLELSQNGYGCCRLDPSKNGPFRTLQKTHTKQPDVYPEPSGPWVHPCKVTRSPSPNPCKVTRCHKFEQTMSITSLPSRETGNRCRGLTKVVLPMPGSR